MRKQKQLCIEPESGKTAETKARMHSRNGPGRSASPILPIAAPLPTPCRSTPNHLPASRPSLRSRPSRQPSTPCTQPRRAAARSTTRLCTPAESVRSHMSKAIGQHISTLSVSFKPLFSRSPPSRGPVPPFFLFRHATKLTRASLEGSPLQ